MGSGKLTTHHARLTSNDIGEGTFRGTELADAEPEKQSHDGGADNEPGDVKLAFAAEQAPSEAVDDAHNGVQAVEQSPFFRDHAAGESDRRNVKAKLYNERND